MKNDLRLYIAGKEIEFSSDPKILLNYKETELHNPVTVRNMFTKQITVEGTNRNNDIFGHIWNLDRIQAGNFNPIQKTDFQLFMNGELYQKGYCKLDKVTRTNNTTQYAITLFGSLGSFFYNLTYDQDDSSNAKKTLASLKYSTEYLPEPDLSFTINKDAVHDAWEQVTRKGFNDNKWDVINFVPALNGIPNDFDAAKVLINFKDLNSHGQTGFQSGARVDDVDYRPVLNGQINNNGYSLGEMPHDMQEWQTRDIRSYNQRPCINMKRIIEACCQPENNGGYQVKLDQHFFHVNNPYYYDSWVTMPLLKDLDGVGGGETYDVSGATIERQGTTSYYDVVFDSTLATINNVNMNLSVRFTPDSATTATSLYGFREFNTRGVVTLQGNTYVKEYQRNTGVIVQLLGFGAAGAVVAQSKAYLLGGQKNFPDSTTPMWEYFWTEGQPGVQPEYEFLQGYWRLIGGEFIFVDPSGKPTNINFTFSNPGSITSLVLKVYQPNGEYTRYYVSGRNHSALPNAPYVPLYTSSSFSTTGRYTYPEARTVDRVDGVWSFIVEGLEASVTDYEGLFSGTKITKERLLTTEYTPADYLLSYCKLFGLYFYYDSTEEADDPEKYPSGVVHIMDRDTFYTDEVVDLSEMIDWDKKIEITPAMASSKWYKFDVEHVESELEAGYSEQFGKPYGAQLVNTNYNFDSNTTDLYDGNVFKSGIMALEKDKYYKKTLAELPVYQYNGFTYQLYARTASTEEFQTTEIEFPQSTTMYMESVNPDYEFYDLFPKLELHGQENQAEDGSNILVFFKGAVPSPDVNYWLTDDVNEMVELNDGTPCWLLTNSEYDAAGAQIARKINYFPYFTRDLILFSNYGNIVHSWNFGHPQIVYSPDTYSTDGDSIYDKCWRKYIADLYNVNTRKLTCYVRAEMDGRPWPYWLRRFYWFENSIWRLNEIKDLNPASFDTTKMEFIKVQSIDNYKLDKISYEGNNEIVLDDDLVDCSGGTITGTIYMQGAGGWAATDWITGEDEQGNHYSLATADYMDPIVGRGDSATTFTITVPAYSGFTPITWTVAIEDDFNNWYRAEFMQSACNTGKAISLSPSAATIPATATTINYEIHATDPARVRLSSAALPQDLYNNHESGHSTGTFTIPANLRPYVEYYGLTAWIADDVTVVAYGTVEQLGGSGATLTGITLDNVSWVTDVPATGGTASYQNCTYTVTAHYSDNTTQDITSQAIMSGSTSINVPATTAVTREQVGVINVIALYYDGPNPFTATQALYAYQEASSGPTPPTPTQTFVTYNLAADMGENSLDMMVEITSNCGYTDSVTAYVTGDLTDAQDIDVYFMEGGSSSITIDVDTTNIQVTGGEAQVRMAYGTYDSGYITATEGNVISAEVQYVENTILYVDVVFVPEQTRAAMIEEEEPEEEEPEEEPDAE